MKHQVFACLALLAVASCREAGNESTIMKDQVAYSLCPTSAESWSNIRQVVREFAHAEGARLVDRSDEAQKELAGLSKGPGVLATSGGRLIMVTVEKSGVYKIVLSNLGLTQKLGLSIRQEGSERGVGPTDLFMDRLKPFWAIEVTDGAVKNDPPC